MITEIKTIKITLFTILLLTMFNLPLSASSLYFIQTGPPPNQSSLGPRVSSIYELNQLDNSIKKVWSLDAPKRGTELQYEDYKKQEVEVNNGNFRFLISDIHFNEYLQNFYSDLDYDNINYYYNFGVSLKLNDNSKQQVKIVVDSAFIVFPNLNKTQDIDLVDQDTKEVYGRFYTPIGALIIPKSHLNDAQINLTIMVYEQSASSLISNQHVSVV